MICVGNSEAGFSYIIEPFSFPGVKVVKKWLARVLSVFTAGLILSPLAAKAQQITGELGSPSATTTIDGKQLPAPEPAWSGQINNNALQSKPWWPPRIVPPKSAPNILLIMTDDVGFGAPSTFGGVIPTPALDEVAKSGHRPWNLAGASKWLSLTVSVLRATP